MAFKMCKELSDALRIIASQLPVVNNNTSETHLMKGSEIMDLDDIKEIDGKPIIPERIYVYRFPVLIASNHYRRLKRAWMRNGKPGVQHYLRQVEKIIELNKRQEAE